MMIFASEFESDVAIVFIDIAVIMIAARVMGALFQKIRQPSVVGEILAGVLLGPTLLGAFPGNLHNDLFPPGEVRQYLGVVAQLGLVIFMFIVGMELDPRLIQGKARVAGVISVCSVMLPFALGIAMATVLHDAHDGPANAGDFWTFALFIGASMSVTAFPVLARILTERGMYRTPLGALVLACAAVDDVLAWSLLAVVVAQVESGGASDLYEVLFWSFVFVIVMLRVVRPLLRRLADRYRETQTLTPVMLSIVVIGVLVSSYVTSEIRIHFIFGAFMFGAVMPREATGPLFHDILERLEPISVLVLLPVFFIVTGLSVDVTALGAGDLAELGLILLVACSGKFFGALFGARVMGIDARRASAIGILMNTRGLTELVILNIGFSQGVLDQNLFTMLVIMALITTAMTEPILRFAYPDRILARDVATAERAALGIVDAYRVLVVVDPGGPSTGLADLAVDLTADEPASEVILSLLTPARKQTLTVGTGLGADLDRMSTSWTYVAELEARARARGRAGNVVGVAQFSENRLRDVLAQIDSMEADVVVVAAAGDARADDGLASALLEEASASVIVVWNAQQGAAEERRVEIVHVSPSLDEDAATEVALRLARAAGSSVGASSKGGPPSRRTTQLLTLLRRAGITVREAGSDHVADSLVIASPGTVLPPDAMSLRVKASADRGHRDVEELVERLAPTAGRSARSRPDGTAKATGNG